MQIPNATSDGTTVPSATFITAYGPKLKVSLSFTGPGRTKQSHKDECDINKILDRYRKTGTLEVSQRLEPQYGDVTGVEFQEAQFKVAHAKGLFAAMPAHIRNRFANRPERFLAFVQNADNRAEAEKLGLLKPREPAPAPAAPAPAPTAAPAPAPAG